MQSYSIKMPDGLSLVCPTSVVIAIEEIDFSGWDGDLASTTLHVEVQGEDIESGRDMLRVPGDWDTPRILRYLADRIEIDTHRRAIRRAS